MFQEYSSLFYVRNQLTSQGHSAVNNVTSGLFFRNFNAHFNYYLMHFAQRLCAYKFGFLVFKITNSPRYSSTNEEHLTHEVPRRSKWFLRKLFKSTKRLNQLCRITIISRKKFNFIFKRNKVLFSFQRYIRHYKN